MIKAIVFAMVGAVTTCNGSRDKAASCEAFITAYCDKVDECGGECTVDDVREYCELYEEEDPPQGEASCLHAMRVAECRHGGPLQTPQLARCFEEYLE